MGYHNATSSPQGKMASISMHLCWCNRVTPPAILYGFIPPQHINDQHIMTTIIDSNTCKPHKIKIIDYYRLYLGVTTLSGVTLADGMTLDSHMQSGNISFLSSSAK
eukprot:15362327-Ditylum_brightwellii.AAC.2